MLYILGIAFYDIAFLFVSLGYLLKYAFRKRLTCELLKRLFISRQKELEGKDLKNPIWIHAVSVGEVIALKEFIPRIQKLYPEKKILLSVITPSGMKVARKLYAGKLLIIYLPLDISFIVKPLISLVNPAVFLSMETEIWPNLYFFLNRKGIAVIIFNARISDKSFPLYKAVRFLLRGVLACVSFVAAQNETAKQRFLSLGMNPSKIEVTGNMKFRSVCPDQDKVKDFKSRFSFLIKETCGFLIVAGSTHNPEEEIILNAYKKILPMNAFTLLLLCPRHVERVSQIEKTVERAGFTSVRLSRIKAKAYSASNKTKKVVILDTTGDLLYCYSLADIVFVGGSLVKHGGHNILEPAYFSKPVIFGRWMFNFEEIKKTFLEKAAAIEVSSESELTCAISDLMGNGSLRIDLGRRARAVIDEAEDSVQENIGIIQRFL